MAKNALSIIGVLAVLLLGFTVVSAIVVQGVLATINGEGSPTNRLTGINNSIKDFVVNFSHQNSSLGKIYVNWTAGSDITLIASGEIFDFGESSNLNFTLKMPYAKSSHRVLTAHIYNNANKSIEYGTKGVSVYFNNTNYIEIDPIPGCTDPDANNYDPDATDDNGSCTYNSLPTNYKYCNDFSGEKGKLKITSFDITNNGKGDDTEWEYLDEIEIEVAVENTGNANINNVMVEIKIVDSDNNTISKRKMNLNDDSIDLGRINDGDEEIAIFKISEIPIDLENGDYKIYIRAYDDRNPDTECASTTSDFTNSDKTYFEFSIIESDGAAVIVRDNLPNVQASCGDKDVEVSFMVYNVGGNDEDKVLVTLENSKLGINEKLVIDNLRNRKGKEAVFHITIPDKVDKSFAELNIYTYYDYDDSEDELDELVAYDDSSEEQGDSFSIGLEILSCKILPQVAIRISLESETVIGKQVVIKAIVTNDGEDNNFIISTSDLESWAESITVSPLTASIKKGESAEVTITFVPTTTGEHTFKVNTISNGQTSSQSVLINIKEKPSILSGISNTILYAVAGIIAVFILIFLVLIVKISRRRTKPQF